MLLKLVWVGAIVEAGVTARILAKTGTHFSNTITLGTVVVGMLVVIVAGMFTIRANTAKIWRQNYEGEKERADNLAAELARVTTEKDAALLEERSLKHNALNEVAALRLRTDQTTVLREIQEMNIERARVAAQTIDSITSLAKTIAEVSSAVAGIVKTTEGLVGSVEKLNRRLDALDSANGAAA